MSWIVLVVSGMLETVWAAALGASKGFSKLGPSLLFLLALALSMGGLAYAMRDLPVGTAYAVWVGIGAVGTAVWGMLALGDPASTGRIVCLVLIVAGVLGLKLLPS
ncbi:DMT family transporter [Amycolatopsis cihanbeyliensis]|uniref:Quaternary ammonium compound-resistance protein SugE n=1 Tax=Amycolatopsis cihanbeyliensis TaxID=1128664 RepID=A0A542DN62_AMYCI|nr:SMR family transporter [Amycolatopsis cihanbeyliensis]TQJ04520.1 quaternary ammonium compound-resistance protein SugE [Amycolatopsis cihanbeyliensis]